MADINHLFSVAAGYLQGVDLEPLHRAHAFAAERHAQQRHPYGGVYLNHLIEVASSLAAMKLDLDTIVAGLLHGTLKEEVATFEELTRIFGKEVANIVHGATRITNVRYNSLLANQAENIRKLLLAMGSDIRVLLVKLADRLQDMVNLEAAPEEERRMRAQETMDLYAPLASRIGIEWLKRELEDLSFQHLFPEEYAKLRNQLASTLDERQAYVDEVIEILHAKLQAGGIVPLRLVGRPKHLYSIYKKLVAQGITVDRVYDKVAFRILVRTVKECYQALGTVHAEWQPLPGRIKDFISAPKANNYQSLHTTVSGPHGHVIEIQIRTEEMDRVAQEGVAAHWAYKEGQKVNSADARLFKGIKRLVQALQEVDDPAEFMQSLRDELFEPAVYALTPKGEVRELPRGSTPIDFAYAIHSGVGDTCVGARVNGQIVPLRHVLQNGDTVEILTQKNQHPKRAWLQLVKTSRARTRIRHYLRKEENERSHKIGREICERELKKYGLHIHSLLKSGHLRLLLKELRCSTLDEMLIKVGSGAITVPTLVKTLQPEEFREAEEQRRAEELLERAQRRGASHRAEAALGSGREALTIDGMGGMLTKISQCCHPVPGDPIVGFITTGSGISIHKSDCANLLSTDPARWVEVAWPAQGQGGYRAALLIRAENKKNVVASITNTISDDDVGIIKLNMTQQADNLVEFDALLNVVNLCQLQTLQQHLMQISGVLELRRR